MKWNALLVFMVAALALVAGCAAPSGPAEPEPAAAAPEPAPVDEPDVMEAKAAGIEFVTVPGEVLIGKKIAATWTVSGDGPVKTALFYSTKSKADVTDVTMSTYSGLAPRAMLEGEAGEYSAEFAIDAVIPVYVRAYADVGGEGVWTEESVVNIVVKLSAE